MAQPQPQGPMMATSESTPLLDREEQDQHVEVSVALRRIRVLTGLSLSFSVVVLVFEFILAIYLTVRPYYYYWTYPSYYFSNYLGTVGFICFLTGIVSVLNYARLRRDGSLLPWSLNIVVDFIVIVATLYFGILYTAMNAVSKDRCVVDRYTPIDECRRFVSTYRTLGQIVMVPVLLLGLTHIVLLVVRVRNSRQVGSSRGGSWFCGFGRGPFA